MVNWATKKQHRWCHNEIFYNKCKNISYDMPFGYYVEVSLRYPEKVKRKLRK